MSKHLQIDYIAFRPVLDHLHRITAPENTSDQAISKFQTLMRNQLKVGLDFVYFCYLDFGLS